MDRLLSPLGRRIIRTATLDTKTITQLAQLGWTPYDGPAQATYSTDPRLNGWVCAGTDNLVDAQRLTRTGTHDLG